MGISVLGVGGVGIKASGSRADPCILSPGGAGWRSGLTMASAAYQKRVKAWSSADWHFPGLGNGLILGTSTLD
jgi:hypothetical protein